MRMTPTISGDEMLRSKKLSPCYVGPYLILKRGGLVAYHLALPPSMTQMHDVFPVSQQRKYIADPTHVLSHSQQDWLRTWRFDWNQLRSCSMRSID